MPHPAQSTSLPPISSDRQLYHQLACKTLSEIMQDGPIDFATYMQQALYHPSFGYYNTPFEKIGPSGDFTTASQWSDFFGFSLAMWVKQQMETTGIDTLLECGSGSGYMLAQLLKQLKHMNSLPQCILISEISPSHRVLQKKTFSELIPDVLDNIQWVSLPLEQTRSAIVIANEVLDALPVHRFMYYQNQFYLCLVGLEHQTFRWMTTPLDTPLLNDSITAMIQRHQTKGDVAYLSEHPQGLKDYLSMLFQSLDKAVMLFIDYGYPSSEYYHEQRRTGTLKCFYKHHQHNNPLILTAIQDITAHVDFTQVAAMAHTIGFHIDGYTTQANFLIEQGILEHKQFIRKPTIKENQVIKKLLMPQDMGEPCKTMVISKNLAPENNHFKHCLLHAL